MPNPHSHITDGYAAWALSFVGAVLATTLSLSLPAAAQTPPPLPNAIPLAGNQVTLSQTVTVRVLEINRIALSGDVVIPFTVVEAGAPPAPAVNSGATYSLTVNGQDKKIVGSIDADYPSGMALSVELTPPPGAAALAQTLSTAPVDLITNVNMTTATNLGITYTGHADVTAVPTGSAGVSRRITFTLISN